MTGSPRLTLLICLSVLLTVLAACSSNNSSDNPSEEEIASLHQAVREYDLTVENTMDRLLALKRLRVDETSWAEKHLNLPRSTAGGLSNIGSESWFKSREDAWVEWRRLTRDELAEDLESLRLLLQQLEGRKNRMLGTLYSMEPVQANLTFNERAKPAMNRLESVINEVANWYEDYMTDNTNQTLQRSKPLELVPLLADAPALFIDARLRWATVKSELPR